MNKTSSPTGYPDSGPGYRADYIPGEYQTIVYRIEEDRIFRDGHLRYFDHPKFGVIARVKRIDENVPDDTTNLDDLEPPVTPRNINSGD